MISDVKFQLLRARVAEGSNNLQRAIDALMRARELQIKYVFPLAHNNSYRHL